MLDNPCVGSGHSPYSLDSIDTTIIDSIKTSVLESDQPNSSVPPTYAHAREQRGPLDPALGVERDAVPAKLAAPAVEVGLHGRFQMEPGSDKIEIDDSNQL